MPRISTVSSRRLKGEAAFPGPKHLNLWWDGTGGISYRLLTLDNLEALPLSQVITSHHNLQFFVYIIISMVMENDCVNPSLSHPSPNPAPLTKTVAPCDHETQPHWSRSPPKKNRLTVSGVHRAQTPSSTAFSTASFCLSGCPTIHCGNHKLKVHIVKAS